MTVYDSSVLIDYLAGERKAVDYVESHADERALVPQLAMFEVYQGEIFKTGDSDFDAVDQALDWTVVLEESGKLARGAANLQRKLHRWGEPLSARDAYIAGTAMTLEERFAVADADFDVNGIRDVLTVDFL